MHRPHDGTRIGRRQFLRRLLAAGAGTGLAFLGAHHAPAWRGITVAGAVSPPGPPGSPPDKQTTSGITVPADDPAISAGAVEYPGVITPLMGYLSMPAGGEIYPAVLVLHDVFGLTEHIRDVTRRLAKIGYVALAPDLLSRAGGTAKLGDPAKISAALASLAMAQYLQDLNRSVSYLGSRPLAAKTRIGALGFGLGGSLTWPLLAQNPDLKTGVMLYSGIPQDALLPHLRGAVLAIFGEADRETPAEIADLDTEMKKSGLPWAYKIEPKASRGFFDDTRNSYVTAAAKDAWQLTLDWYSKQLGA